MKYFKKSLLTILSVFMLFLVGAQSAQVKAALPVPKKNSFDASFSSYSKQVTVSVPKGYDKCEVNWYNSNRKLIETRECYSYAFFDVKLNKLFYYQVRGLIRDSQTGAYVPATEWSAYKAIWTPKDSTLKAKLVSKKSRTISIKVPKISGVKSYTVYMSSKSSKKGYKKIGTLKPGKTLKISKFSGKAFAYYKNYYYKVTPNLKKKASAIPSYINGFYISRVFR